LKVQSDKKKIKCSIDCKKIKISDKNPKSDEKSMLFLNKTSMLRFADF